MDKSVLQLKDQSYNKNIITWNFPFNIFAHETGYTDRKLLALKNQIFIINMVNALSSVGMH